jgi:hypothetical protein
VIDGLFEFVVSALAALAAIPLGFFFPCSPCCGGPAALLTESHALTLPTKALGCLAERGAVLVA